MSTAGSCRTCSGNCSPGRRLRYGGAVRRCRSTDRSADRPASIAADDPPAEARLPARPGRSRPESRGPAWIEIAAFGKIDDRHRDRSRGRPRCPGPPRPSDGPADGVRRLAPRAAPPIAAPSAMFHGSRPARNRSGVGRHGASADRSQAGGHAKPGAGLAAADAADPPVRGAGGDALPEGQKIGGFCHLYSGQEPVAVGSIGVLREDDYVITAYRDHGHALARGHGAPSRRWPSCSARRPAARRARAARCTSSTPRRASSAATRSSAATSRWPPGSPSPSSTAARTGSASATSATAR